MFFSIYVAKIKALISCADLRLCFRIMQKKTGFHRVALMFPCVALPIKMDRADKPV